jgi:ABC-type Fe3+-siderophore transport system permease subunit
MPNTLLLLPPIVILVLPELLSCVDLLLMKLDWSTSNMLPLNRESFEENIIICAAAATAAA